MVDKKIYLHDSLVFMICMAMSFAGTSDAISPCALALVSSSCTYYESRHKIIPIFAGSVLGCMIGGRYIALISVMIYSVIALFIFYKKAEMTDKRNIILLFISNALIFPFFGVKNIVIFLINFALTLICCGSFHVTFKAVDKLLNNSFPDEDEKTMLILACAIVFISLSHIDILKIIDLRLSVIIASYLLLCINIISGSDAIMAACAFSLALVLGGGASMLFIATLCICTLGAVCLRGTGYIASAVAFGICAAFINRFTTITGAISVPEAITASILFCFTPRKVISYIHKISYRTKTDSAQMQLELIKERVGDTGSIVERLADLFTPGDNMSIELSENMEFTSKQLKGVSSMLNKVSTLSLRPDENKKFRYRLEIGTSACTKEKSVRSGDSFAIRRIENKLVIMLSDGMGSGVKAHEESSKAISMLSSLFEAGFDMEAALDSVNRLLISSADCEIYATLDLLIIDLMSGMGEFIKYGASPSYLLRGGKIYTVYSEALPFGIIPQAKPSLRHMNIEKGDKVFMMTDGVTDALSSETLAIITEFSNQRTDASVLADKIISYASEKNRNDDMTAIVIAS